MTSDMLQKSVLTGIPGPRKRAASRPKQHNFTTTRLYSTLYRDFTFSLIRPRAQYSPFPRIQLLLVQNPSCLPNQLILDPCLESWAHHGAAKSRRRCPHGRSVCSVEPTWTTHCSVTMMIYPRIQTGSNPRGVSCCDPSNPRDPWVVNPAVRRGQNAPWVRVDSPLAGLAPDATDPLWRHPFLSTICLPFPLKRTSWHFFHSFSEPTCLDCFWATCLSCGD